MPHTLDELNAASPERFAGALDGIFEHSPWIAAKAAADRPFATVASLHDALMNVVRGASEAEQLAFLRLHPALSLNAASLTAESQSEQAGLGLAALAQKYESFETASRAYTEKFGFPFLICVRRHTPHSILRNLLRRVNDDPATERAAAIYEIGMITRLRLSERVEGPGMPKVTGHISTHVLDTAKGHAAEGIVIELFREGVCVATGVTNRDGRTNTPLMQSEPLRIGGYELRFHVGSYFADAEWHDVIPVRFSVTEPEGHYHLPLLVTPWSYTTYRGS